MFALSKKLILGSQSPRRQQLLRQMGFDFTLRVKPVDEIIPPNLPAGRAAAYLSELKASAFTVAGIANNELIITCDTVVTRGSEVLGKPAGPDEAYKMLRRLSGNTHRVISAFTLTHAGGQTTQSDEVTVEMAELENEEIEYYISRCQPFDKAGAYGIQEWIGIIGIKQIEGSFYTVMGLPAQKLFQQLKNYRR